MLLELILIQILPKWGPISTLPPTKPWNTKSPSFPTEPQPLRLNVFWEVVELETTTSESKSSEKESAVPLQPTPSATKSWWTQWAQSVALLEEGTLSPSTAPTSPLLQAQPTSSSEMEWTASVRSLRLLPPRLSALFPRWTHSISLEINKLCS